jgi:hypothetical protein
LLNGLFVLVLASLIHAAFEAFHLKFDVHLMGSDRNRRRDRSQGLRRVRNRAGFHGLD